MGPHKRTKLRQKRKIRERRQLKERQLRGDKITAVINCFIKGASIAMLLIIAVSTVGIFASVFNAIKSVSYASSNEELSSISTYSVMPMNSLAEEVPEGALPYSMSLMAINTDSTEFVDELISPMALSLEAPLLPELNLDSELESGLELESEIEPEETLDVEELIRLQEDSKANLEAEADALGENYALLNSQIDEFYSLGSQISPLYEATKEAKVCSKANKFNNSIQEIYSQMSEVALFIEELYSQYADEYAIFEQEVEEFNSGRNLAPIVEINSSQEKYEVFMKYFFGVLDESLYSEFTISMEEPSLTLEKFLQYEEEVYDMVSDAQQIADDFFDLVFYDMSHIANAEAGCNWFPPEDIYYVLNVIENRVESPKFAASNTHDVIFAPGQYSPTWSGSFYYEPTEQVKERTTTYLRGYVDTGMPSNVVFQAPFEQGNETWKYMESSGHYFCISYGA